MLFHKYHKEWRCQWCDKLQCVSQMHWRIFQAMLISTLWFAWKHVAIMIVMSPTPIRIFESALYMIFQMKPNQYKGRPLLNSICSVFSLLSLLCMNEQFQNMSLTLRVHCFFLCCVYLWSASEGLDFSTNITRNWDASDVISFNVFQYILHSSLLSTHLAYPCSSPAVRISVVTGFVPSHGLIVHRCWD